jgi:hypothetical protein
MSQPHSNGTAPTSHPDEQVWQGRVEAFFAGLRPILAWTRGAGHTLSLADIHTIVSLPGIASIVDRDRLPTRWKGQAAEIVLAVAPDLTGMLREYLWETPGYDPALPCAEQSTVVSEQHFLVLFTARRQLRDLANESHTR